MKDIVLALFSLGVMALGMAAPFVLTLGYFWASILKPQNLAYGFFKPLPIAMILAVSAVLTYFVVDRRAPPKFTALHMLMGLFALWVTLTTFNALYPQQAWWKWNWAFKEIAFACFIPFVIRTRIHLEALLYVLTVGTVPLVAAAGFKAILSGGGGYGEIEVAGQNNVGLAESSMLAMFSVMAIVIVLYLRKHTLIMPRNWIATVAVAGYVVLCLAAAVGSFARTGLVAFAVMAAVTWWFSRYKIRLSVVFLVVAGIALMALPEAWYARMDTILHPAADTSASTRLEVWGWTLRFVQEHPFGGGFFSYLANLGFIPGQGRARAFHSIYFEVLGEHGYVGLVIFVSILLVAMKMSYGIYRRNRGNAELIWLSDLGRAVLTCLLVFASGGAFIGVAFQPWAYLLSAMVIMLRSYEKRYHLSRNSVALQGGGRDVVDPKLSLT
ncbi:MAG: putative O-glycosylation ligase, exosortase A system-associated [Alphaproteobacteria bacterium]|nr:putative O-glycosylation ligase, exosortase A system-associated [Alphaproteobacteria bacterium]MCB9929272.1 putative O-glycosylation ligase, exosortase A system-associated [Alphaproteobacteria bacterium]